MASKLAEYNTGYEDERFEHPVGHSLHCSICMNVIKDPVACRHNEHIFCRACITKHLKNYQTCPSCMDPLTVDTLSQAPRTVMNLLAELKIRCKFFDRGCGKFIELGNLESHLRECGFAPAVCSNEGCQLEVNRQDLLHHETAVCEQRRIKSHNCNDIRQEMDLMKGNLAAMNEKLDRNEKIISEKFENVKLVVDRGLEKLELVQKQLNQEFSNRHVQRDIVAVKKNLNEITKQLERMTQQTCGIAERELKVVIAGGFNRKGKLKSVEMFSLSNGTWIPLQPMRESRREASSVVRNNQLIVVGGRGTKSIEKLPLNAVQADQSIIWENVAAELPVQLWGHCSVIYNGRLIVVGGYDDDKSACTVRITEISLVPPSSSKLLTTMPHKRCWHGLAIFADKIVVLGGSEYASHNSASENVLMYDLTKSRCKALAPLPYPVCEMATVKWGDDHVIIMGGVDSNVGTLSTVLIYNIKTQKSHMLPDMKYKRRGCVAAVVKDNVIVMGGRDERDDYLKSVECFRFDRYTWEELPEMHEARCWATAAAVL